MLKGYKTRKTAQQAMIRMAKDPMSSNLDSYRVTHSDRMDGNVPFYGWCVRRNYSVYGGGGFITDFVIPRKVVETTQVGGYRVS